MGAGSSWGEPEQTGFMVGLFFLLDDSYVEAQGLCEVTAVFFGGTGQGQTDAHLPWES